MSFPALVIGSVVPDLGYCLKDYHVEEFSHRFLGSIGFCLPAGLLIFGLSFWLRTPLVRLLPENQRRVFLPLCDSPPGPIWVIVLSLLVGAWTHLFWDSFTHKDGWFVRNMPLLQYEIGSVAGYHARVCHVLWYGGSFAGVACVFAAYRKWQRGLAGTTAAQPIRARWAGAIAVALLLLPIELVHHLVRDRAGTYLVMAATVLVVAGVAWKTGSSTAKDFKI